MSANPEVAGDPKVYTSWDPRRGSPDFVTEAPAYALPNTPRAMASVHCYVRNVALWLAGKL